MSEINTEAPEQSQTETKTQQEIPKPKAEVTLIPINEQGKVVARNNSELLRYCGALVLGDVVPQRFDTPQKLFAALMFVRDLGLPDTAIRQVANIHGTMCAFGDLPLALAQRTGELIYFEEKWFDREYNVICFENKNLDAEVYGAVCWIARSKSDKQSFSWTLRDSEQAGLYPAKSPQAPWAKYTRLMLRYKARSIALKSLFADAINGVGIAEYDFDALPESDAPLKDVTPREERHRDMRSAFRQQLEENA